jgi:predicted ABC-type ATPase
MDGIGKIVTEILATGSSTLEYYFEKNTHLMDQRLGLHKSIVDEIISKQDYSCNRRVYMLGGAPANGKSNLLKSGFLTYPTDALKADSDEIKLKLPEYRHMLALKEPRAAVTVHEESSRVNHGLRLEALKRGMDIVWDGLADDSLEHRLQNIRELKMYGHTVRIDYVTLDTDLSLRIAEERFLKTGRKVPEEVIKEANRSIANLVPKLISSQIFDELYLWDTNIQNQPRLILSQKNGKLEVEDEKLYRNFKLKDYVYAEARKSAHKSRKRHHRI